MRAIPTSMAKRSDQAPLDAIRLVLNTCTMALTPLDDQVNALPKESDLEYYFVPAEHMSLFAPYYRPGQPFKNLKLINYDRPAIALTFYTKHKYKIDRDVKPEQASEILLEYRKQLYDQSFLNQLTADQEKALQQADTLLRAIRQEPDQFQFCTSNYHHYYRYWYCSFRYFEDEAQTKTGTDNEHMLKYTLRNDERSGQQIMNERLNIIFVDTKQITKPVPYDNKLIGQELETYPDRITLGKTALYVRSAE